jgi:hypothetical protein
MMAHADHTAMGVPAFTLSYYLTDSYIDGEIEFPSYNLSLKAEANSVVVFPSYIPHSVRNVPEGIRITMQDFIYDKKSENERIKNYD